MESNELRLKKERKPRNKQHLVKLTSEIRYEMQNRQWIKSDLEHDLDSIRKFSILNCIRERVFEVLSKLPVYSIEFLCEEDIDGLVRRNLLKERKVRFTGEDEFEGEPRPQKQKENENENEKNNVMEEMDIILKVLGNDKQNNLIIENFELLEQRISRVEQRLSGLIRKMPECSHQSIKIDIKQVRYDLENFVGLFNKVFSSDYDIPMDSSITLMGRNIFSSTNRLKHQILSRIMEPVSKEQSFDIETKPDTETNDKDDAAVAACATNATKLLQTKLNLPPYTLTEVEEKIENLCAAKAVDSLIALRERFKEQSVKWIKLKAEKAIGKQLADPTDKLREIYLSAQREEKLEDIKEAQAETESEEKHESVKEQKIDTETVSDVNAKKIVFDSVETQTSVEKDINIANKMRTITDMEVVEQQNKVLTTALEAYTERILREFRQSRLTNNDLKSVPAKSKKKSIRSQLKDRKQRSVQPEEPKDMVVQYVNRKVLKNSSSQVELNKDQIANTKNKREIFSFKFERQQKLTKHNNKETILDINRPLETTTTPKTQTIKGSELLASKDPTKKIAESIAIKDIPLKTVESPLPPNHSKPYKKIFLFKLQKSASKQRTSSLPKKSDSKTILREMKKSTEKSLKKSSIIKIFPKPSKIKAVKQPKETKKSGIKSAISNKSLLKLPTKEQTKKFRSTWLLRQSNEASANATATATACESAWNFTDTLLKNTKTRKSSQKSKKKKGE